MTLNAYVRLVEESVVDKVTLEDVKAKFDRYVDMTSKTGQQLSWGYASSAFPYTIEEKTDDNGVKWLYLKGKDPKSYKYIFVGVGSDPVEGEGEGEQQEQYYIQIVLPETATHGDKGKANEFCKYLAREYKAILQLFNGRIMYYNPRKNAFP